MEIDLLVNYPKTKRNPLDRLKEKTAEDQEIARRFDKEFFDGDRKHGYGGFSYNPKFWQPVVPSFKNFWNIKRNDSLLDVGCAKGFMLYDFKQIIPGLDVKGIDISNYAIKNALPEIRSNLLIADAKEIPFEDNSFDHVIAINTIHNLNEDDCAKSLREITRVSKKNSFITVDAWRNDEEKKRMLQWNLTALSYMHVDNWKKLFKEVGYDRDFYWFIP